MFPAGQLYVNLRGATQQLAVSEVLARFLRVLGVDAARIPADVEERAALYRTMLADRRMLIVLDDARDAEQVQPLLPGNPCCAVVVTARGQMPELAGAKVAELDVLPPEDAFDFFARIVGEKRALAEPCRDRGCPGRLRRAPARHKDRGRAARGTGKLDRALPRGPARQRAAKAG
jgi:NB-ARC domain